MNLVQLVVDKYLKSASLKTAAPKVKTYKEAQFEVLMALKKKGWDVVSALKVPHAMHPDHQYRLWFKPQAVYSSNNSSYKYFEVAQSTWNSDLRQPGAVEKFLEYAEAEAKKSDRR